MLLSQVKFVALIMIDHHMQWATLLHTSGHATWIRTKISHIVGVLPQSILMLHLLLRVRRAPSNCTLMGAPYFVCNDEISSLSCILSVYGQVHDV